MRKHFIFLLLFALLIASGCGLGPRSAEDWMKKGQVYFQNGRYEDAQGAFEKVMKLNPSSAEAAANIAMILVKQGKAKEASGLLDLMIKKYPQQADVYTAKAIVSLGTNRNPQEAESLVKKALSIDPANPDGLAVVPYILAARGRMTEIPQAVERITELNPDSRSAWENKIMILKAMGETEKVLLACGEFVRLDKNDPHIWFVMGESAHSLGNKEDAFKYYKKSLETGNAFNNDLFNMGADFVMGGRYADALDCFKRVDRLPLKGFKLASFYGETALAYEGLKRYDDAIRFNELAAKADDKLFLPYWANGLIKIKQKKFFESISLFEEAVKRDPRMMAGIFSFSKLPDLKDIIDPELKRREDDPKMLVGQAFLAVASADNDGAKILLKRARKSDPKIRKTDEYKFVNLCADFLRVSRRMR